MAKYQYRIAGTLNWQSNSGNAILAISNPIGSGRKLTIKSLELTPKFTGIAPPTSASFGYNSLAIVRTTISGGDVLSPTKHDANSAAWPSSLAITRGGTVSTTTSMYRNSAIGATVSMASLNWFSRPCGIGRYKGFSLDNKKDATLQKITIRAGESVAAILYNYVGSVPLRVCATLIRAGTPNSTFSIRFVHTPLIQNEVILGISNAAASGEVVYLADLTVEAVGDLSTPYFQLVPIGSIVEIENTEKPSIQKLDTNYPDPSAYLQTALDVPILPLGMPESALADSSAGSPKGFNYFKSKDFVGPTYRSWFPEYVGVTYSATAIDTFGSLIQKFNDPLIRRSDVTIRPGEGVGLVSSAESATGSFVSMSGWATYHVSAVINVEPEYVPTLTLTGLKNPSEVRIFVAGTTTLITGQEDVTTGTFQWQYDPTIYTSIDISILALSYQNIRILGLSLTSSDVSIPIQQQLDRQYQNI